ncbi:MAG: SusD/RagB family nutrient-binding outer membrane lipoprotein, partial [Bacteroidota bacterium]|nr:SusD/RagB family nutrient-binding outer membrane lipoprotein [Bacteroidota bacterium]
MKNYKYIVVTLLSLFIFACSSDEYLQSLNIDSKNPSVGVPDELFFTNAEKALMDKMSSININTSIFRFITQYTSSPIYTQESQYNFRTRTISGNHWRILYSDVLTDLRAAKSELLNSGNYVAPSELRIQKNRLAMVEVLEVYTFAVLVDT